MIAGQEQRFWPPGRILAISGQCPIAIISNFGLCSTELGGTVSATKKMTHIDNGPGPGRIYRETAVLTFCQKAGNWPNIRFFLQKKTPEICLKTDIYVAKVYFFLCTTLPSID